MKLCKRHHFQPATLVFVFVCGLPAGPLGNNFFNLNVFQSDDFLLSFLFSNLQYDYMFGVSC